MREIVRMPAAHSRAGGLLYAATQSNATIDKHSHFYTPEPELYENLWTDAGTMKASIVKMAAQHHGEYVYGITRHVGSSTSTQYGFRDNSGLFSELRFNDSTTFYDITAGAAGSSNPISSFDLSPVNAALHVSDHYPPRLWFISGHTVGYCVDNGKPWAWHSVSNPPLNPTGWTATHRFKFSFWHYYQEYAEQSDLLPALAPVGPHNEPKLWWFNKIVDANPDLYSFRIIQQSWEPGTYLGNRGYLTVSATGTLLDVSTNTEGYAFGNPGPVGTVGPFPGMGPDHQPVFKVLRDPHENSRIWLVAISSHNVYATVGWDGAWHCYSDDSGATWSRPKVMHPAARSTGTFSISYGGSTSVTMTGDGYLVIPVTVTNGGVPQEAYSYINYAPSSAKIDPGYGIGTPSTGTPGHGGDTPVWLSGGGDASSRGGRPEIIFRRA
jgi:hypothetical protein